MTTEALRKVIQVHSWKITAEGYTVYYHRDDQRIIPQLSVFLSPQETVLALYRMACIDGYGNAGELKIDMDGVTYKWIDFVRIYKTCQWEALQIAIGHEAGKELANNMNMLELDSAIAALK